MTDQWSQPHLTEIERFTRAAQEAVEELAALRDDADRDPDRTLDALRRGIMLIGSIVLWFRCNAPAAFEQERGK